MTVDATLSCDDLIARAQERAGLDDFGPGGWQEGLEAVVSSAASEGKLNGAGIAVLRSWINERLDNRLKLVDWASKHPDETGRPIEQPLVVTGLGRSGTTFTLELLAADPTNRALMKWEASNCIPPPEAGTFDSDPRIAASIEAVERTYAAVPALRAVHYEPGDGPTECLALLGLSFRGADYPGLFTMPSYQKWYLDANHQPAYEFHRIALGVLQSRAPGRWVLKDPWHVIALDSLFAVYPNVRVVVLHRDPVNVVPSMAALSVATAPDALRQEPVPPSYWGRQSLDALSRAAARAADVRATLPAGQFLDIDYDDLVADPVQTVSGIYAFAGRDFSDGAEAAVRRHVADRTQHKYGVNRYTPEQFGLRADEIRARFA